MTGSYAQEKMLSIIYHQRNANFNTPVKYHSHPLGWLKVKRQTTVALANGTSTHW
jgi:hypothetical protein